jgi:two-component system NtrC family sensor kinase
MPPAQILIVEDEVITAEGIGHTLARLGYEVPAIVHSSREAIDKAGDLQPDLVLMDIRLKGKMDGIEAAQEIQTRFDLPVVYLTAHADDETLAQAKTTRPAGYLLKPVSADALRSTLEMALYNDQARKRLKEREKELQAEEALERRAAQLALLNDVGGQIAAELDLDLLLDRAVHLVQERFGYHHVTLFTPERGRPGLAMRARAGDFEHLFAPDYRLTLGQGLVGWVGTHGETLLVNDVEAEPRYVNRYPDLLPTRSELTVPIRMAGEIVGVLDIQSPQLDAFDENDVRVIETVADQLAVALQNASLYESVQQELDERKRTEGALRESEERLWQIVEQMPYPVEICTPDGTAAMVNQAFLDMFGIPSADLVVDKYNVFEDALAMEDMALADEIRRVYAGQTVFVPELAIPLESIPNNYGIQKGGYTFQEVTMFPVLHPSGEIWRVVTIWKDISERKEAENALRRHNEELQALLKQLKETQSQLVQSAKLAAIGELAAGVAHELNNPLTSILGFAELAASGLAPDNPGQRNLEVVIAEARRARDIVRNLLEFARQNEPQTEPTDVNQTLHQTLALIRTHVEREAVQIVEQYASDLDRIPMDAGQMKQVFLNLITNAAHAMPEGGKLTVSTVRLKGGVAVRFTDTGRGIPTQDLKRLFEPFFTTKPTGTGLGLSVSLGIVQQHGGEIEVESRVGEGSTFTIWLPGGKGA